jgi:hypothetical protein
MAPATELIEPQHMSLASASPFVERRGTIEIKEGRLVNPPDPRDFTSHKSLQMPLFNPLRPTLNSPKAFAGWRSTSNDRH